MREESRVVAEACPDVQNAGAARERQCVDNPGDDAWSAVEQLPAGVDGDRVVVVRTAGIGVCRRPRRSTKVSLSANQPWPGRQKPFPGDRG